MVFVSKRSAANVRSGEFFFSFLFNFGQGLIHEYFIYKLVPDLQTFATFRSFVQMQRNQRPLLRYDLLYPDNQLEHVFENQSP